MNCFSHRDNLDCHDGWIQNSNPLEGATREDFNGRTNSRILRRLDPVPYLRFQLFPEGTEMGEDLQSIHRARIHSKISVTRVMA
jgi:hypothetical protein